MLREIQEEWKTALLSPPGGKADIAGPDAAEFDTTGFVIHQNNILTSLSSVLAAAYPTVQRLVGDEFFYGMAKQFIRRHPPERPELLIYGEGFVPFIEAYEPARTLPYLADVAAHDWARTTAYHAADAEALDGPELAKAARDGAEAIFLFVHPSARLIRSIYPVFDIWMAHQTDDFDCVDIDAAGQSILVLRRDDEVLSLALSSAAAALAGGLISGQSLLAAAQAAADADREFALQDELAHFLALGLFVNSGVEGN